MYKVRLYNDLLAQNGPKIRSSFMKKGRTSFHVVGLPEGSQKLQRVSQDMPFFVNCLTCHINRFAARLD